MHITFFTHEHFGTMRLYITELQPRKAIERLTGQITVTTDDLYALQALGHTTEEVMESETVRAPRCETCGKNHSELHAPDCEFRGQHASR